jgi:hypothetical protein
MNDQLVTKDRVLAALTSHIGEDNGIHMDDLAREFIGLTHDALRDGEVEAVSRRIRAVIEDLRDEGHHVCAHPKSGYFMAATAAELEATCKFLRDRALASLKKEAAMRRVALPDLLAQLRIPS